MQERKSLWQVRHACGSADVMSAGLAKTIGSLHYVFIVDQNDKRL